jgi:hypothetical protein
LWAHLQTFQFVANHFPKCWFPTIVNDIHIIDPLSIIWAAFEYLTSKLNEIVLWIQLHKGVIWSPSYLLNNFTPTNLVYQIFNSLKVFGIPIGFSLLISLFINDVLLQNLKNVKLFLRMGDVQITFGTFIWFFW